MLIRLLAINASSFLLVDTLLENPFLQPCVKDASLSDLCELVESGDFHCPKLCEYRGLWIGTRRLTCGLLSYDAGVTCAFSDQNRQFRGGEATAAVLPESQK
jgi:hypothetical protein